MHIATETRDQPVAEDRIIEFPRGLPGFEAHRRFRLLHEEGREQPAVHWLQSLDDEGVQISVTDPASLQVNYEIALDDEESKLLQLDDARHCAVLLVLFRALDSDEIRANFMAPVLINTEHRLGMQKALNGVERSVTIRAL